jgi:hypothetical protein
MKTVVIGKDADGHIVIADALAGDRRGRIRRDRTSLCRHSRLPAPQGLSAGFRMRLICLASATALVGSFITGASGVWTRFDWPSSPGAFSGIFGNSLGACHTR